MNKHKNILVKTQRLYFCPFTKDDFDLLYKIRGNAKVMQFIHDGARSYEAVKQELADEIEHQQKYGFSKWAVFLKETDEFIGRAGFSVMDTGEVEVGYGFLPEHWGKSYATETLKALLEWAFANIDVPEILAFTHKDNIASKKVIEKCGIQFYKQELLEDMLCNFYYKRKDGLTVSYGKALTETELEYVEDGFSKIAYEKRKLPPVESFCINLYDQTKLKATIYGSIYYGCMDIDTIFIDEKLRNKGYGKELMRKAENLAKEKNCNFIIITTMDWEARDFYEKLGYKLEYERKGYMNDAVLYGLKKDFRH